MSFDNSGDKIIPNNPIDSMIEPNGRAVVEDAPDDTSECSLEVKILSLNDIGHGSDSLPNVEEDVDVIATVDSSDAANMVDINEINLDDKEIPQLNQSDLEMLKDAMTAPRLKRLAEKGVTPAKFSKMNYPL